MVMHVAVVGGGVGGLVAAAKLKRLGANVTLFEKQEKVSRTIVKYHIAY